MANSHTTLTSLFDDIADAIRTGHTALTAEIPADYFPDVIRVLWAGKKKALNDCSWEYIRWASDAGIADLLWSIGDRKGVNVADWGNTNNTYKIAAGTYYCYIVGFNHNEAIEGSNRIHFEFGFDSLSGGNHIAFTGGDYTLYYTSNTTTQYLPRMNTTKTNVGGWESCSMRTGTLNGSDRSFKTALPSDLINVLKTVTKYTDNVGGGTGNVEANVTATTDTIFIMNVHETRGTGSCNTYERNKTSQYAYYINGNEQTRKRSNNVSELCYFSLRSPSPSDSTNFMGLSPSGVGQYLGACDCYGISPCFCV